MATFGIYTFVNGYMVTGLGLSNEEWTASTLWFLTGMLAGQLLSTEVAHWLGRRYTVTGALLVAAAGYGALSLIGGDVRLIRIVLSAMGFVPAMLMVVWISMAAQFGGRQPGRAIAICLLLIGVVSAAVLAGGAKLLAENLSYEQLFAWTSGVSVLCAGVFCVVSRHLVGSGSAPARSVFRLARGDVRAIFTGRFMVLIAAGFCLEPFLWLTCNQLFPNLGRDVYRMGEETIGEIVALGRLPGLVVLLVLGHFIDRLRPYLCYGAGMVLVGMTVMTMGHMTSTTSVATNYVLYYLAYMVIWSANMAALNAAVDPEFRDSGFAIGTACMTLAVVTTGTVHNRMISAGVSLPNLFTICGAAGATGGLALVIYSFARRRIGRDKRR